MALPSRSKRIVLALDHSHDPQALALALLLARHLHCDIETLFVEDTDLLRLAQLPFSREVSLQSAILRPIDSERLQRELRQQAQESKRRLEQASHKNQIQSSFAVVRDSVSDLLQSIAQPDYFILGRRPQTPSWEVSVNGPIITLFDGSKESQLALQTAARAAPRNQLLVLVPTKSIEGFNQLQQQAFSQLQSLATSARFLTIPGDDITIISETVRSYRASTLILPYRKQFTEKRALTTLLERWGGSLLLVRHANGTSS